MNERNDQNSLFEINVNADNTIISESTEFKRKTFPKIDQKQYIPDPHKIMSGEQEFKDLEEAIRFSGNARGKKLKEMTIKKITDSLYCASEKPFEDILFAKEGNDKFVVFNNGGITGNAKVFTRSSTDTD
jgi:hypothetical protein